ncbi:hypothetical protein [Gracilibacillus dipsosauri]|uniref:hypothetical protein n=1 Tax=Gracilibacillus dipsosauri TaxID=178340 RepID=UPI002408FC73
MYEWLVDYQKLKQEIEYLEYKLEREKRELRRWVYGDLQDVKLHKDSISAKIEERIAALEYELAHKMNDLYDAEKLISKFKGLENKILYFKYVEGLLLEEIAEKLNYSPSYIYKKHAEIMRMIKFADSLSI